MLVPFFAIGCFIDFHNAGISSITVKYRPINSPFPKESGLIFHSSFHLPLSWTVGLVVQEENQVWWALKKQINQARSNQKYMRVHKKWALVSLSRRLTLPQEGCNRIEPSPWYFKDMCSWGLLLSNLQYCWKLCLCFPSGFFQYFEEDLNWGSCYSSLFLSPKHFPSSVCNFFYP